MVIPKTSLSEYASFLQAGGHSVFRSSDEVEIWVPSSRNELLRLPIARFAPVAQETIDSLLRGGKTWAVDYLLEPNESTPANAFLYLCRDPDYDMSRLSKNGRKAIRRGLSHVDVRRISWDELGEHGFAAMAETNVRHGFTTFDKNALQRFVEGHRNSPFHEVWGAWEGTNLLAYLCVLKVDDWADYFMSPSRDAALRNYANNALRYEATRHLLTVEKRRVVGTGLSNIKFNVNSRNMYAFNTRMGFDAVPVHRVIVPCWWLRLITANRPSSLFVGRIEPPHAAIPHVG